MDYQGCTSGFGQIKTNPKRIRESENLIFLRFAVYNWYTDELAHGKFSQSQLMLPNNMVCDNLFYVILGHYRYKRGISVGKVN